MAFDDSWAESLYERRTLAVDPLGSSRSQVLEVSETEFYELDSEIEPTAFNPKSMHYIIRP